MARYTFHEGTGTILKDQSGKGEGQCAVVRRIPMHIESAGPVNLHVSKYDDKGCELVASGRGPAILTIGTGDFSIRPGTGYVLRRNGAGARSAIATREPLSFPLELADESMPG